MKLVHCSIFILSIFLIAISCDKNNSNPVNPGTTDEYGSIVVSVVDQFDLPYEGVMIHVDPQNGKSVDDVVTNAEGIARFDSISPGEYSISFSTGRTNGDTPIIDYKMQDITVSGGEVVPVRYNYPAPPVDSNFGALMVTVYDVHGNPFEGVVTGVSKDPSEPEIVTTTNANGIARFDSLKSGLYDISFSVGRMNGETPIIDHVMRRINVKIGETTQIMYTYPFDPDAPDEYGTILVSVVDEFDNPFEGVAITIHLTQSEMIRSTTDAEGIARFGFLLSGNYSIWSYGIYDPVNNVWLMDDRSMDGGVSVSAGETVKRTFYYPQGPGDVPVRVYLEGDVGSGADGVNIYFPLWDRTVPIDGQGHGVLRDVVLEGTLSNKAIITRDFATVNHYFSVSADSTGWPYIGVLCPSRTVVNIDSPSTGDIFHDGTVRLVGDGLDIRKGYLPDEVLAWYSDIDGELGTGRDITTTLSVGLHTIVLIDEDSFGGTTKASVKISVYHFSEQSYFPLPHDGVWKYSHSVPELVVTTDTGETEHWTLEDMTVTSHDVTARTCHMDWTVESDGEQFAYRYTLTDNIEIDEQTFRVTSTDELLSIYDGSDLVRELAVETDYTPSYPLMADYLDPQAGAQEDVTVTAESVLAYTVTDLGVHTTENTESVTVSYETSSSEDVTTAAGTYATIPYLSTYNGVERTWWLAKGIGIVQMEYDLFGETVTASLCETNMEDFVGGAGKRTAFASGPAPVRIRLESNKDDAGRMREIMGVMRGMCPR